MVGVLWVLVGVMRLEATALLVLLLLVLQLLLLADVLLVVVFDCTVRLEMRFGDSNLLNVAGG